MKHPSPSARAAASALATLSLLLSTTGCASSGDAPSETASSIPAASTSQIDEPTASPAETTEPAQAGEVDDINQLECVGDRFTSQLSDGYEVVKPADAQAASDCVQAAGQVKLDSPQPGKFISGYAFAGHLLATGEEYDFFLLSQPDNPEDLGVLRARKVGS